MLDTMVTACGAGEAMTHELRCADLLDGTIPALQP